MCHAINPHLNVLMSVERYFLLTLLIPYRSSLVVFPLIHVLVSVILVPVPPVQRLLP